MIVVMYPWQFNQSIFTFSGEKIVIYSCFDKGCPKKRKSVQDRRLSRKYLIPKSMLPAISSLRCTVEAIWILSFY